MTTDLPTLNLRSGARGHQPEIHTHRGAPQAGIQALVNSSYSSGFMSHLLNFTPSSTPQACSTKPMTDNRFPSKILTTHHIPSTAPKTSCQLEAKVWQRLRYTCPSRPIPRIEGIRRRTSAAEPQRRSMEGKSGVPGQANWVYILDGRDGVDRKSFFNNALGINQDDQIGRARTLNPTRSIFRGV